MTIKDIFLKYFFKIDSLDLELLIAHAIKKTREFVLAHPEYKIPSLKIENLKFKITRRMRGEPLAYILGHKEFYELDFKVDRNTLIPRPETELLVDLAIQEARSKKQEVSIIDVGTGSGNIIISIAKAMGNFKFQISNFKLFATDISNKALIIAKYNARKHKVEKIIKFLRGNLLEPLIKIKSQKLRTENYIILANLPYLSPILYKSTQINVKKYEPRSALLSTKDGLAHYEEMLKQIKLLVASYELPFTSYLEISPEQKPKITQLIKKYFPRAKIGFHKDLASKWRVCQINL